MFSSTPKLTSAQQKSVKEFRSLTSSTEKEATTFLSSHSYNVERAVDAFYSSSSTSTSTASAKSSASTSTAKKFDKNKLSTLFDLYSTKEEKDLIADEKLAEFFKAIGVDPSSSLTLYVAKTLKCKTIGEIERKEFIGGWETFQCDNLESIKNEVKKWATLLEDTKGKDYREFYRWTFDFIKEEEERKLIDAEVAYEFWPILLGKNTHFKSIENFISFCKNKEKLKSVSKDLWDQFFDFAKEINEEFTNYEEDGAFPVVIDNFVEEMKKSKAQESKK